MSISKERKEYLLEKFKYAAKEFGKSGTKSNHLGSVNKILDQPYKCSNKI